MTTTRLNELYVIKMQTNLLYLSDSEYAQ